MSLVEHDSALHRRIATQRAARLARDAEIAAHKVIEHHRQSAPMFWDNIDSSGGLDACHLWTGAAKWNHPPDAVARFEQGCFSYEGCETWIATRVLCFALYGREPPRDMDIMPICGDHLCCNVRHLAIVPHGGVGSKRINKAVPVEEFFCA